MNAEKDYYSCFYKESGFGTGFICAVEWIVKIQVNLENKDSIFSIFIFNKLMIFLRKSVKRIVYNMIKYLNLDIKKAFEHFLFYFVAYFACHIVAFFFISWFISFELIFFKENNTFYHIKQAIIGPFVYVFFSFFFVTKYIVFTYLSFAILISILRIRNALLFILFGIITAFVALLPNLDLKEFIVVFSSGGVAGLCYYKLYMYFLKKIKTIEINYD